MKTTISISPIVIDTFEGCRLAVSVTYQSDDLEKMQKLEKELKDKIELMQGLEQTAIEQVFCEDCISRKSVNDLVNELIKSAKEERWFMTIGRSTEEIIQDIFNLPSATPAVKTGGKE